MAQNGSGYGRDNEPIRRYRRRSRPSGAQSGIIILLSALVLVGVVVFIMSATGTGLFRDPTASTGKPGQTSGTKETVPGTGSDVQTTEPPVTTEPDSDPGAVK